MVNFNQLADEFGGINGKLIKGKDAYKAKTVMDMVATIQKNISTTIEALSEFDPATYNPKVTRFRSPMARKVRNGFSVKVGYGSRNEKLSDELQAVSFFEDDIAKGIGYLRKVGSYVASGEVNEVLEAKLQSFRTRAELGKEARKAKA
jgi:hypothetical protein